MIEELNECATTTSALYDDGFGNFFLDDVFAYEAKVVIPSVSVQSRIDALLAAREGGRLHDPHYNLVAYPWSTRYQNSNQWVLETLARALSDRPVATRAQAQAWLHGAGYRPSVVHVGAMERLGAELFRANVAFDDHPQDERLSDALEVVTADSVMDFMQRIDAGARVRVISVSRDAPITPGRGGTGIDDTPGGNAPGRGTWR